MATLPDGRVVSGSGDKTVKVWNMEDRSAKSLTGHSSIVRSVSVFPDGRLVSGSDDTTLRLWRVRLQQSGDQMRRRRIMQRRLKQKKKSKQDIKLTEIFEEGKRRFEGWKDQEDCPICFEPLGSINPVMNKTIVFKRCGHAFHKSCILKWQKRPNGNTCPYCTVKGRIDKDIGDGIFRYTGLSSEFGQQKMF